MPRAVKVWTWRRALRDQGPSKYDTAVYFTLLALATWMDGDGFCFPSQGEIARAARTSVRTVQRRLARARALGWLWSNTSYVPGKHASRRTEYRACLPEHLVLSDTDEELADALSKTCDEIPEAHDTHMAAGSTNGARSSRQLDVVSSQKDARKLPPNSKEAPAKSAEAPAKLREAAAKSGQAAATLGGVITLHLNSSSRTHHQNSPPEEGALPRTALCADEKNARTAETKTERQLPGKVVAGIVTAARGELDSQLAKRLSSAKCKVTAKDVREVRARARRLQV